MKRRGRPPVPLEERFWAKVDKVRSMRHLDGESCWEWTAVRDPKGYGVFTTSEGKKVGAHRVAYELLVGPIPEGLVLDHLCRNPGCVRPSHLEPVTFLVNVQRGHRHVNTTHCPNGHEYTPENTGWNRARNHRHCLICTRARTTSAKKAYRARQRLASDASGAVAVPPGCENFCGERDCPEPPVVWFTILGIGLCEAHEAEYLKLDSERHGTPEAERRLQDSEPALVQDRTTE